MHERLVSLLVALALLIGAGSPLPYGHSLVVPAPLLGSLPDEPSNERPRVLGTVGSKSHHSLPALAYERATVQVTATPDLLAMGPATLARLAGLAPPSATAIPVPLRC
jgi:hypothetical protein